MIVHLLTPDFPPSTGGIQRMLGGLVAHAPWTRTFVTTRRSRSRLGIVAVNARAVGRTARLRPDVVLSGHVTTAPAAIVLARSLGLPYVQLGYGRELAARPWLTRCAFRQAAGAIAISRHTAALIDRHSGRADTTIIHPGFDAGTGAVSTVKASRPTIVTVARLDSAYKGHDVLLDALERVRHGVPDVEWVVVGDGRRLPWLRAEVARRGLESAVRLVGNVDDARRDRLLATSHVFAMPSRTLPDGRGGEGFGIVYLEAGALGLPCVAGRGGGAADAVIDRETGLLVDPTDADRVADAIGSLLTDPARAADLGAAAAARARQFTWARMAANFDAALRAVLAPEATGR